MQRSPEDLVRQHFECLNRGDPVGAAELFSDDAMNHGRRVGRDGVLTVLRSLLEAFPDAHWEIVDLVAVGEAVACRTTDSGTHLGTPTLPFVLGGILANVEPTGKRSEVSSQHWFRVRDSKIIEHWAVRDDLSTARQLGLLPQGPQREK
jgi:predicted ester cyclase